MSRVLVLAGGSPHAHDFDSIGDALVELVSERGHDVERVDDPGRAARRLADMTRPPIDVLVMAGLWWRMEDEAYDEWRDRHGYSPPPEVRAALADWVHGGGGFVALHTTVICFDDWPEWADVVGGGWRWGTSSHPPYGPVIARIVREHPVVDGVGTNMRIDDEVYGDLALDDRIEVLAEARRTDDDDPQPVVWAHRFGAGRVVFDGFGHDAASIAHHANARIITQAIDWVTGPTGATA